jgi:transposase-like protein
MSTSILEANETRTICPSCDSDAVYRYGKIKTGRQRFMCLMCGSQFTPDAKKPAVQGKPLCPECGKTMNVYKLEGSIIRFRCSGYPDCKTFRKFRMKEEE